MKRKETKWLWLSVLLVFTLALSACGIKKEPAATPASGASDDTPKTEAVTGPLSGKRIALIMEFNTGTFSQQYVQGVKEEIEKFGGELTTFVADNDKAKMVSLLDSAINQQVRCAFSRITGSPIRARREEGSRTEYSSGRV